MLRLAFPVDLLPQILTLAGDVGISIKIECILLGLPLVFDDASRAFEDLKPHHFPASMKLTQSVRWDDFLYTGSSDCDEISHKSISLCEVSWIIKFRPHILMSSRGSLWQHIANENSSRMFMALHKAKLTEGFPMKFADRAVKAGSFEAVEYLHEQGEACEDETAFLQAARKGCVAMFRYLREVHGKQFGPDVLINATRYGRMQLVIYLCSFITPPPECLQDAAGLGYLEIVKFLVDNATWKPKTYRSAIFEAIQNGHADILEVLCMQPFGWNSLHVALAKAKACIAGNTNDAMAYYRGPLWLKSEWIHMPSALNLRKTSTVSETFTSLLRDAAQRGSLDVVKFLLKYDSSADVCGKAMQCALLNGHLHVAEYLRSRGAVTQVSLYLLSLSGDLKVIQYCHQLGILQDTVHAIDAAAQNGYLEVVKFLHETRIADCTHHAMDRAAGLGHLEVVKWLHQFRHEGCTATALNVAAKSGHLEVVKWLHSNRSEGCTVDAINLAGAYNHLDVVEFLLKDHPEIRHARLWMDNALMSPKISLRMVELLHSHRLEICLYGAMDVAATRRDPSILHFLHRNRINGMEGFSTAAVDNAAGLGLIDNVKFLLKHRQEGGTSWGLSQAIRNGHVEVAKLLIPLFGDKVCFTSLFHQTMEAGNIEMARFLIREGLVEANANTLWCIAKRGFLKDVLWMEERGCKVTSEMLKFLSVFHPLHVLQRHWPDFNEGIEA
ncbi:hypothetical protein HDU97_000171 [Phlyctochytrium planicorne]|nr:hypothetical protein HDU97_000171 [Phlyctochytrium planicorne]